MAGGTSAIAQAYFTQWTVPVLAFAIFGLFGLTSEARASYQRIASTVGAYFRRKSAPLGQNVTHVSFGEMAFDAPRQDRILSLAGAEVELGFVDFLTHELLS